MHVEDLNTYMYWLSTYLQWSGLHLISLFLDQLVGSMCSREGTFFPSVHVIMEMYKYRQLCQDPDLCKNVVGRSLNQAEEV